MNAEIVCKISLLYNNMRKYDGKWGQMGHYKVFNDVRFKFLHKKQIYRFHKQINCSRLAKVDSCRRSTCKRPLAFPGNIYVSHIYRVQLRGIAGLILEKKGRFKYIEKVTTLLIYGTVVGSPRYSGSVFGWSAVSLLAGVWGQSPQKIFENSAIVNAQKQHFSNYNGD